MIFFSALFFLMLYLCERKFVFQMKKLGVLTAMSVEFNQLAAMLADEKEVVIGKEKYLTGIVGENEIVLVQCGIGKVNAAMGVSLLIERFHPDMVISTGVAGGVDVSLNVMDVVVSTETVYHDMWCGPGNEWGQVQGLPLRLECDKSLVEVARNLNTEVNIVPGLICTGDLFVDKTEEQQRIKNLFPDAMAVDMESNAIAQVCRLQDVPFVSFRIISDTPVHKDNFLQYEDFWQTMADKSFTVTRTFLINI